MPISHHPEDLVLLVSEGAQGGEFQIVPQNPDEPHDPFTVNLAITENDEALLRFYVEESHIRKTGTTERAAHAERLVKILGRKYFHQLFASGAPLYDWWQERSKHKSSRIVIVSNSPAVHRVHWELLRDETRDTPLFDLGVRVVRKLQLPIGGEHSASGLSLLDQNSKIHILVISPRPKPDYLQLPLGNVCDELRKLDNVIVEECVPPTLEQLRQLIQAARDAEKPFTIVHFDGHGIYKDGQGALIFENENGDSDVAYDDRLGTVFRGVPVVVLDACRTADTGGPAWEAVAPLMLRLGVGSVIAMPYAAHIDMMRLLFRTFYRELAARKTIGGALDEGRRAVLLSEIRRAQPDSESQEHATIRDWWVPQLFQRLKDHRLLPAGEEDEHTASVEVGSEPRDKQKFPYRRRVYWFFAFATLLLVVGGISPHLRLFDSDIKKRLDANANCNNSHNSSHCNAALELNKECCNRQMFGWSDCCYQAGLLSEDREPPESIEAAWYYEKACSARSFKALACLNLGMLYQTGSGVPKKDLRQAADLFAKACKAGIPRSCSNAGRTYLILYNQSAQKFDFDQAKLFFGLACSNGAGDPSGCTGLGKWYVLNNEPEQALLKYLLACEKKDALGCKGVGDVINKPSERADYYQRACDLKDVDNNCPGCINRALLYESSNTEQEGPKKASEQYETYCNQGCGSGGGSTVPEACRRLASHFLEGTGGRNRDLGKAEGYFQKGCDASDGVSCAWLGYLRKERDPEGAMRLLSKSCAEGARLSCCMASQMWLDQGNNIAAKSSWRMACEVDSQCCPEFPATAQGAP